MGIGEAIGVKPIGCIDLILDHFAVETAVGKAIQREDVEIFGLEPGFECGQVVVFEDRRGAKLFERYGFKVLNRSEITKYRDHHPEPVYLCTVIKELA